MPLKIKSASGSVTINAENVSGDQTLTVPSQASATLQTTADTIASTRLTGALPAVSGASLTNLPGPGAASVTEAMVHADAVNVFKSGRKNLFINGGFDVWQRAISQPAGTSYLADRWYNATTETQSRQTFTPGQTDVDGFPTYYHRGAGGSTEWYGLKQKVENVGITGGREVTLSYWMKGSSAFTNAPYRVQNFGSGGSSEVNAALSTASITTSWARYTHTFTVPSISGKTVGAGSYMQINIVRANVNNVTIDLANCQLEFGPTATDFEQRSYGEELALCQRYYQQNNTSRAGLINCATFNSTFNTNESFGGVDFPVQMRVSPTVATYRNDGSSGGAHNFGSGDITGVSAQLINNSGFPKLYGSGVFVVGRMYGCNWTADAEL
jgi:hypothetical protein